MAFDLAWDFRATSVFVTDPAYACFASTEVYPNTYTNGNGLSLNAGWTATPDDASNLLVGNDPRIAGRVRGTPSVGIDFQIDLSSGSAPGAGTYTVDVAFGREGGGGVDYAAGVIKDDTTTVIDATNGGAGFADGDDHFRDATVTNVTATTTWTGATVTQAFATTTVHVVTSALGTTKYNGLAHFRLTLQGGDVVQQHFGRGIGRGFFVGR